MLSILNELYGHIYRCCNNNIVCSVVSSVMCYSMLICVFFHGTQMTLNEFCMSFNDLVRHNEGNADQWKLNKENTIINARKCYFVCAVIQFKVCLNTFLKKQP